jgi:CheY-like chemotaxis protein
MEDVLEVVRTYLEENSNYRVSQALSGGQAIEALKNDQFDLVVTDVIMDDVNGIELVDYIKKNFPNLKILVYSGGGDSGRFVAGLALDQAIDEGATAALLKPFSKEELLKKVVKLIGE